MVDKWNKLTNGVYLFIVIRYVMVILADHKLCLSPIQVQPVSRSLITTASTKLPMLANVIRASSIVSITCDMAPVKPFKVDIARSASSSKSCKFVCMYVLFVRVFFYRLYSVDTKINFLFCGNSGIRNINDPSFNLTRNSVMPSRA